MDFVNENARPAWWDLTDEEVAATRSSRASVPRNRGAGAGDALYKLDDPEVVAQIGKKYAALIRPGDMYRAAFDATALLAQVLASPTFSAAGELAQTEDERWQRNPANVVSLQTEKFALTPFVKDHGAQGVELRTRAVGLKCRLTGVLSSPTEAQKSARKAGEQILRSLLSGIKFDVKVDGYVPEFGDVSRLIPVESLTALNVKGIDALTLPDGFPRGVAKLLVTLANAETSEPVAKIDPSVTVNLSINVQPCFYYPQEYALWATHATREAEFIPFFFYRHVALAAGYYVNLPKQREPAPRTPSVLKFQVDASSVRDTYKLSSKPKTNDDGFCILPDGSVIWVPPEGSPDEFVKSARDATAEDGRVDFSRVASKHVWTDWTMGRLYYTHAESGDLIVRDLTGARPLDPVSIGYLQTQRVLDDKAIFTRIVQVVAANSGISVGERTLKNLAEVLVKWENLIDVPPIPEGKTDKYGIALTCKQLGRAIADVYNRIDSLGLPVFTLVNIKPYMALVAKYGVYREQFQRELGQQFVENTTPIPTVMPVLHDLGGVEGVMPHQVSVSADLCSSPKAATIAVDAGGGKTLAYLIDITDLFAKGLIKRPCVIMPRNLVPQFANEGLRFSQGHLRFFPLTSRVWRQMTKRVEVTPDALRKLIEAQPRNTVFLIDYTWLALHATFDELSSSSSAFYPYAELLADVGFDYCVTGDTLVSTRSGLVPMEQIVGQNHPLNRWGDVDVVVNTPHGPHRATKSWKTKAEVFEVTTDWGHSVKATAKHPFLVLTEGLRLVWRKASELRVGDVLCIDKDRATFAEEDVKFDAFSRDQHFAEKSARTPKAMTRDLARLMGYVISEGSCRKNSVVVSNNDEVLLRDVVRLSRKLFGVEPWLAEHRNEVHIISAHVAAFMRWAGCDGYSANKEVPWPVLRGTQGVVTEFLRAYYEGDGHAGRTSVTATSKSRTLVDQLQTLLLNYGIVARSRSVVDRRWTPSVRMYYLHIRGHDKKRFASKIGFLSSRKQAACAEYYTTLVKKYRDTVPYIAETRSRLKQTRGYGNGCYDCDDGRVRKLPLLPNYALGDGGKRQGGGFFSSKEHLRSCLAPLTTISRQAGARLAKILRYDFVFRPVESIVSLGEQIVYDITVPKAHSFFANGLVVHNCCADESQRAKNIASSRTEAVNVLAASAKYVRIGSGTILHNTAKDLIGQMSLISPVALGSMGDALAENDKVSLDRLPELGQRIRSFARQITAKRRKWAHLLPPVVERVHTVQMTRAQRDFYQIAMDDLLNQMMANPKVQKLIKEKSDKADNRLASMFRQAFAKLEIWLNAPDTEFAGQYGDLYRQREGLTDEDLISPKVRVVDSLLDVQFSGGDADIDGRQERVKPSPFKVIVFCYNKAVTEHIYRHSRYANRGVYYTAGDDDAIKQFKENDDVRVLYADENSLNEGHNFQMADRLIRMQSLWTPGSQEQAMARIVRPSVPDKNGNIKYPRDRLFLDWVVCDNSIEIAKMARLLGKMIENSILQEIDSNKALAAMVEANQSVFASMPRLSMDLDFVREYQTADKLPTFFEAYSLYKAWEKNENENERAKIRAEVEKELGRPVRSIGELASLAMRRVTVKVDAATAPKDGLYGQGFTPWIEGYTGYTPDGLHLEPLSLPPDEEDDGANDDGGDGEDNVAVTSGDVVVTEYGIGIVTTARSDSTWVVVRVPGFKDQPIRVRKYLVKTPWIFPRPNETAPQRTERMNRISRARAALKLMISSEKSLPTVRYDAKTQTMAPVADSVIPVSKFASFEKVAATMKPTKFASLEAKPKAPLAPIKPTLRRPPVEEEEDVPEDMVVDLEASAFNGQLCLLAASEDDATDRDLAKAGFDRIGKTASIRVKNPKGFHDLLDLLASKFYIPRPQKRILDAFAELYTQRRENVAWLRPREYAAHAVWVKDQKRKATEKNEIRPYPVVENGNVYVYINLETCPSAIKLRAMSLPAGVAKPQPLAPAMIAFITSRAEAATVMRRVENAGYTIEDRARVMAELKQLR